MPTSAEIQHAAELLRSGGLVAFPTETVYGLGANACDANAVAHIFASKQRPHFDPLIVHVPHPDAAWQWAAEVPPLARQLAEAFWPGPLTLVLPKTDAIPDIVTSGLRTVGLRVPDHDVARKLLDAAGVPVAAPSANPFGGVSPTRASHVTVPCDLVLDGGPCRTGVESTVVGFDAQGQAVVLRLGGTSVEAIEAVTGGAVAVAKPGAKLSSPGMLERHYAPGVPLELTSDTQSVSRERRSRERLGVLVFNHETFNDPEGFATVESLSPQGDLHVAAAHLFEALRRLDAQPLDGIIATPVPDHGLGRAINDRLRRAAARD
ncbi:MAG: L-threonylcarbamoyladenylate synthase [Algisphaera sp.]